MLLWHGLILSLGMVAVTVAGDTIDLWKVMRLLLRTLVIMTLWCREPTHWSS